jgi:hypothetical protein
MRLAALVISTAVLVCACGDRSTQQAAGHQSATDAAPRAAGAFRLIEVKRDGDGTAHYKAAAGAPGSSCEFEILLGAIKPTEASPFSFTTAALIRAAHADCEGFLSALAPELGFDGPLPTPPAVAKLDASIAILGVGQSRATHEAEVAGGFTSTPPGPWLVTKLFLADGEGEVSLNLDERDKVGELSIKDTDYAQVVVTELAKILLPEHVGS